MKPIRETMDFFLFEPADEVTARDAKKFLDIMYPEATWEVKIVDSQLVVNAHFASPEEETFYRLKWE